MTPENSVSPPAQPVASSRYGGDKSTLANILASQTAPVLVGYAFTFLIGFPLQIYVVRHLGAEDLGEFSMLETVYSVVASLLALGIAPTLVKYVPTHITRAEYSSVRSLVWSGGLILTMLGLLAFALIWLAIGVGPKWILPDTYHPPTAIVMALLIPLGLLSFLLQQALRGFLDMKHIVIGNSFLQLAVKSLLALTLIELGYSLHGWAVATVVGLLAAVAWLGWSLSRRLTDLPADTRAVPRQTTYDWQRFAAIQYTGSLIGIASAHADRLLIGWFSGYAVLGVFVVVASLYSIPRMLLNMLITVATPLFSAAHSANNSQQRAEVYYLTTDWSVRFAMPLIIFIAVFADRILLLYGAQFSTTGHWALVLAVVAQLINMMVGPLGPVLNMSGLEKEALRLRIYHHAVSIVTIIVFAPTLGLMGAVLSTAVATLFINACEIRLARQRLALTWWNKRYLSWIAPGCSGITAAALAHVALTGVWLPLQLALSLALIVGVSCAAMLMQGLEASDRAVLDQIRARLR